MIKSLDYKAVFARTGRTLQADLSFETGLTAITGPNEAGKSMIVEVIRWCLFGSDALRGSIDDYTMLVANLSFEVKGEEYSIHRSLRGGRLHRGDDLLATGTRPMNAKLIEILGFDLEVFDIACAANQGDVEKLASMRSAERKRMVDRVIGADKIEELSQWCGTEATLSGRSVSVLERTITVPTAPVEPAGYRPATELRAGVEEFRLLRDRFHELRGWLGTRPSVPQHPGSAPEYGIEELTSAEKLFQLHVYDFDRSIVADQWAAYDLWEERQRFDRRHPRPEISRDEAERIREADQIEAQLRLLGKSPVLTCPCGQPFTLADAEILELQRKRAAIILPVEWENFDANQQLVRNIDWEQSSTLEAWERLQHAEPAPRPDVTRQALEQALSDDAILLADRATALRRLGVALKSLGEVRAAIRQAQDYQALLVVYEAQKGSYEAWKREEALALDELQHLEARLEELDGVESQLAASLAYEAVLTRYEADLEAFRVRTAELEALKEEQLSWANGRLAFNLLRERIKTYLVPSLSKAASSLLSQMTGGARNSIIVDESFEVTVDGQPLGTLSGSGKACANLALRIGLGQVLTNNVLSIFIGDEIDASMDEERAANIQSSLANLSGRISQIFIVTHKIPQADHVIELGSVTGGCTIHSRAVQEVRI